MFSMNFDCNISHWKKLNAIKILDFKSVNFNGIEFFSLRKTKTARK
jgi:hypothetical protein